MLRLRVPVESSHFHFNPRHIKEDRKEKGFSSLLFGYNEIQATESSGILQTRLVI
jgi:hypothetical protein